MNDPLSFILGIVSLIIAITVHEFAHAFFADRLGDPTPRLQGRLTLNPLSHLDPLGTLMIVLVHFGWGKPVQFDPFNLRNPRRDAAIISLAGPASNIILATLSSILIKLLSTLQFSVFAHTNVGITALFSLIITFLESLIILNVILAVFNLIPIHPLDGFKIVGGLLSPQQAKEWYSLERYGIIFLLLLIFPLFGPAPISYLLTPVVNFFLSLFLPGLTSFI